MNEMLRVGTLGKVVMQKQKTRVIINDHPRFAVSGGTWRARYLKYCNLLSVVSLR